MSKLERASVMLTSGKMYQKSKRPLLLVVLCLSIAIHWRLGSLSFSKSQIIELRQDLSPNQPLSISSQRSVVEEEDVESNLPIDDIHQQFIQPAKVRLV
jgi:hypothetical protein